MLTCEVWVGLCERLEGYVFRVRVVVRLLSIIRSPLLHAQDSTVGQQ